MRAFLPVNILYSITLVAGFIGNIFVISIYATKMRKNQRESRYFIPVLASYDLMVCILSEIYFLSNTFFKASFRSDELCKILLFFLVQTMMTSDAFLLAIAIQRYTKICRPLGRQMTLFWRRLAVALIVTANIMYSVPTAFVSGVQEFQVDYRNMTITGKSCSTGNNRYPLFQLVYYGIIMLILVVNIVVTAGMYTPIALVIYRTFGRRNAQQRTESSSEDLESNCSHDTSSNSTVTTRYSENKPPKVNTFSTSRIEGAKISVIGKDYRQTRIQQNKRKASKKEKLPKTNFNMMFFGIIFVYVVAYIPTAVVLTYATLDDTIWTKNSYDVITFYTFLIRSYAFNHAANPFIYVYFDIKLRVHVKQLFCRKVYLNRQ